MAERKYLEELTVSLGVEKAVSFCGWLSHSEVLERLQSADALVFPSVRDFGGGVVFEGLACGTVPIVVDFGGPGDIVSSEVGYKIPLTDEVDMAARMEKIMLELAADRDLLRTPASGSYGIRKRAIDLGCEGTTHHSSAVLGCWTRAKAGPGAAEAAVSGKRNFCIADTDGFRSGPG